LYDDGASDPSAVTRDYVLKVDALPGAPGPDRAPVLSSFGGKITTYRKLAEHALRELAPYFPGMKAPWTATAALPGGDLPGRDREQWLAELTMRYPQLPQALLRALAHRHGTRATLVLGDAKTTADLGPRFRRGAHRARVDYLVREEWATSAKTSSAAHEVRTADDAGAAQQRWRSTCNEPHVPVLRSLQRRHERPCLRAIGDGARRTLAARGVTHGVRRRERRAHEDRRGSALRAAGGSVIGVITEQLRCARVGQPGLTELIELPTITSARRAWRRLADAFVALARGLRHVRRIVREWRRGSQLGIHTKPLVMVNV
jgi:hypothetical protein